jgi:hypothetical protein
LCTCRRNKRTAPNFRILLLTLNLKIETETFMSGRQEQFLASTLAFGLLGAGLVYFGRRANPGILAGIVTTAGYGLVTKAVSAAVFAALDPSEN